MTRFDLNRNPIAAQEPVIWAQRDASLGQNSRQNGLLLAENQCEELYNIDLSTPGQRILRKGSVKIGNTVGTSEISAITDANGTLIIVSGGSGYSWTGSGNWAQFYGGIDSYTTLLLHCDGTNDSETITDSSSRNNTVTNVANAKIKTAVKNFGTASLLLNGTTQHATVPSDQKLTNGSFETWTGLTDLFAGSGDFEAAEWTNPTTLTNWTYVGAGGTLAQDGTTKKVGSYSALVTRVTGNAEIYKHLASPATYANKTLVVSGWVYSPAGGNTISIFIGDGVGGSSVYHTGSGWEFLSTTLTIAAVPSYVSINLRAYGTNGVFANFDDVKVYEQLAPTDWTLSGTGATFAREEGTVKVGTYSAKLTRISGTVALYQEFTTAGGHNAAYWGGRSVTFGCWVYATVASTARIYLQADSSYYYSSYHTGVAGWEYLTVTQVLPTLTNVYASCQVPAGSVAYFDGAFITDDAAANFNFGSGDWTIDTWVNTAPTTGLNYCLFNHYGDANNYIYADIGNAGGVYTIRFLKSLGGVQTYTSGVIATPSGFNHFEFDVASGVGTIRWNGVTVGTPTSFGTFYPHDNPFYIGQLQIGVWGVNGYLDEFRVSKGIARHTSDFTVPLAPYSTPLTGTDISICYGKESGNAPDDVVIVQDGVGSAKRFLMDGTVQDLGTTAGTGSDSPPLSTVMTWYNNRFWILKTDQLFFSDAYDDDYSSCWDTVSNFFRTNVGEERVLSSTRELGLIIGGKNGIMSMTPSNVPAATDQIQSLLPEYGLVSNQGWCTGGDDWYFFSQDGLRGLKRSIQDKLQLGTSYPLSYPLKNEFDLINWARIAELTMVYFDSKVICSVPTGVADFMTWVYYPAFGSITNWEGYHGRCYAKFKINGEERCYYGNLSGSVYRAFYGSTDEGTSTINGTAITLREITKKIDFGNILQKKEGHTFEIKGMAVGDYNITCYVQLDDGAWQTLGTFTPAGYSVTFPTTFPVLFAEAGQVRQKFHLRSFGKFYHCQFKYEMTAAFTDSDPLIITETNALAIIDPYMEE